jgi:hypothetical protein
MTAHAVGKWGRTVERLAAHSHQGASPRAYCLLCQAEHRWEECPLTPEQRQRAMERRARA